MLSLFPSCYFFVCNEQLDLARSQLCGKNRHYNRAALTVAPVSTWFLPAQFKRPYPWGRVKLSGLPLYVIRWAFSFSLPLTSEWSSVISMCLQVPAFSSMFSKIIPQLKLHLLPFMLQDLQAISCATTRSCGSSKVYFTNRLRWRAASSMLSPTTLTELWTLVWSVSGNRSTRHLPELLSVIIIIISCTK